MGEFLLFVYFVSDYFLQSVGSACCQFVNAASGIVAIFSKLVIRHGYVPFLGVP